MFLTKIRITIKNELGKSIAVNSYELGVDFNKMHNLEATINAVSSAMLTDITVSILTLEEQTFLKKVITKLTVAIQ